jgi:proline-specific peptidase
MRLTRRTVLAGAAGVMAAPLILAEGYKPLPQPDPKLWRIDEEPTLTGQAPGPNGGVYYRVYGQFGRTPVIVLHGGPAAGEAYMRPYAGLATDRQVVTYDQSGCGRSARPENLSLYTLDRYVEELEALRRHLAFDKVVLLGHSWGGVLAPAYAAAHPDRVAGLVLAGTGVRWLDFQEAAERWLAEFGPEARATVERAEKSGNMEDPAYQQLIQAYYARHLCRLDPWPDWFAKAGEEIGRNPVYVHLNGPTEFQFTGAFASLDNTQALRGVRAPTLITCGEYDEGPPWIARRIQRLVRRSKLVVFPELSHMAHIEDPARVVTATGAFLKSAEL